MCCTCKIVLLCPQLLMSKSLNLPSSTQCVHCLTVCLETCGSLLGQWSRLAQVNVAIIIEDLEQQRHDTTTACQPCRPPQTKEFCIASWPRMTCVACFNAICFCPWHFAPRSLTKDSELETQSQTFKRPGNGPTRVSNECSHCSVDFQRQISKRSVLEHD